MDMRETSLYLMNDNGIFLYISVALSRVHLFIFILLTSICSALFIITSYREILADRCLTVRL